MSNFKTMASKGFLFAIILCVFIAIASCATLWQKTRHGFLMKGSIIEAHDSEVYLCIGSKDGASVGQELDVYKVIITNPPLTYPSRYPYQTYQIPTSPILKRENTGKVKITEIIDEHFAKARVIFGTAVKNNIVELEAPSSR